MWLGVTSQKNGLALLCVLAIFFLFLSVINRRRSGNDEVVWYETYVDIFLIMLALWLFAGPDHKLNYSATCLGTLVVGLATFFCVSHLKTRSRLIKPSIIAIMVAIVVILGVIIPFAGGLLISDTASVFGRDESLTGRTDIWAYLVPYATSRPIFGHGYGGFWTDKIKDVTSNYAHNGYLDIILDLGFVGYLLFLIFFVSSSLKAQALMYYDFKWGVFWLCMIVMAVIHNIAESSTTSFYGMFASIELFIFIILNSFSCKHQTPEGRGFELTPVWK
ncbi:MAG: O-antigen ligase family protein [Syntrophobacteraceae bacterium]